MRIALVVGVALGFAMWPSSGAAQAPAQTPAAPDGRALYQQHCRTCHGATGVPSQRMRTMYRGLATLDSTLLASRSDDSLLAVLRNGAGRDMKSFKDKLTRVEMVAIVRYLRSLAAGARREGAP